MRTNSPTFLLSRHILPSHRRLSNFPSTVPSHLQLKRPRRHTLFRRSITRAQLNLHNEEADWIIVDVLLRGLDAEGARLPATDLKYDGRELVRKARKNQPAELSVVLCSDEEIIKLNTQWRDKHRATDVLSFPQNDEIVR